MQFEEFELQDDPRAAQRATRVQLLGGHHSRDMQSDGAAMLRRVRRCCVRVRSAYKRKK